MSCDGKVYLPVYVFFPNPRFNFLGLTVHTAFNVLAVYEFTISNSDFLFLPWFKIAVLVDFIFMIAKRLILLIF